MQIAVRIEEVHYSLYQHCQHGEAKGYGVSSVKTLLYVQFIQASVSIASRRTVLQSGCVLAPMPTVASRRLWDGRMFHSFAIIMVNDESPCHITGKTQLKINATSATVLSLYLGDLLTNTSTTSTAETANAPLATTSMRSPQAPPTLAMSCAWLMK